MKGELEGEGEKKEAPATSPKYVAIYHFESNCWAIIRSGPFIWDHPEKKRNLEEFSGGTRGQLEKSVLGANKKMLSPTRINAGAMQAGFPTGWCSELQCIVRATEFEFTSIISLT
jgi:hypothetical protein